jgi:hypothetical protein
MGRGAVRTAPHFFLEQSQIWIHPMFTSGDRAPVRYAYTMTALDPTTEGGSAQSDSAPEAKMSSEPAVSILVGAAGTERCSVCSAEMTADQRYCVECGTRRGKPRFELAAGPSRSLSAAAPQPAPAFPQRAMVLLATAVVLLAIGLGVLIGNSGGSSPIKGPVTVVLSGSGVAPVSGASTTPAAKSTAKSTPPPKTSTVGSSSFAG